MVIGGRGQSGRAIGQRLVADGWEVIATSAGDLPSPEATPGIRWSLLARDEGVGLADVVPSGTDVVIDITCFTPAHVDQLLALGDRVGSAIVMSTLSVYSDQEGRSLDEAEDEASFPRMAGAPA